METINSESDAYDDQQPQQAFDFAFMREMLMGEKKRQRDRIMIPVTLGSAPIPTYQEELIQSAFESCPFKTIFSGVVGFGLGGAIGLFSASVGPDLAVLEPEKQNWRQVLKDMKVKSLSHAKNFGILGAMFAATECAIESVSVNCLALKVVFSSFPTF